MRNVDRSLRVAVFIGVLAIAVQASAFSAGVSSNFFGAGGCNTCHSGGSTPTVTLTGPTTVSADSTNQYTLQIAVIGGQNRGGLNVATSDGVFAVGGGASSGTQIMAGQGGRGEVTHTNPKTASGSFITFSFLWTAPSSPTIVTLDGWGNAVDGNGNTTGDKATLATLDVTVEEAPPTVCDTTPLPNCRKPVAAGKSTFVVKDNALDSKDTLTWNWTKGAETLLTDFGDPVNSTSYHLCVYDQSAGVPTAAMAMSVPAGGLCAGKPCWVAKKTGFLYKDKTLTNDGFMQLQLTAGAPGKAKIVAKGKGELLPMPVPTGPGLFVQDTAVIVQLVSSDNQCWEADFSTPAKKDDLKQFNDKSD